MHTELVGEFVGVSGTREGTDPRQLAAWGQPAATRGPAPRRPITRSDSGRRLEANLLTLIAVVAAIPAFVLPLAWILGAAAVAVVFAVVGAMTERPPRTERPGTADLVVVPSRALGRVVLAAANPVSWLKVLFGAVVSLVIGVVVAALAAGATWLVTEGPRGILAAIRMGAWAHGLRGAAVIACVVILRGIGDTFRTRARLVRRVTAKLPETALAALAVVVVVGGLVVAAAVPRTDLAFARGSDGLGWVPPGLRGSVDSLRDEVVSMEAGAVARCLDGNERGLWIASHTAGNPSSEPDVVRLTADAARAPSPTALASAVLAAHNHLAPWVESVEVAVGGEVVLALDRAGLSRRAPVTTITALLTHATVRPDWLAAVTVDDATILRCSARTPV